MNELPPGKLPLIEPAKAHCGWFAVSEEALRIIDRTFDREGAKRKAQAGYITLLRIANLEGSNVFIRSIAQIGKGHVLRIQRGGKGSQVGASRRPLRDRATTGCSYQRTRAKPVYSFNLVR